MSRPSPVLYFEIDTDHRGRRVCHVPWFCVPGAEPSETTIALHEAPEAVVAVVQKVAQQPGAAWLWESLTIVMMSEVKALILIEHLPVVEKWTQGLEDGEITKLFAEHDVLDEMVKLFIERRKNDPCSEIWQAIWREILTAIHAHFPGADETWVMDYAASLLAERGVRSNHGERKAIAKRWTNLFQPHKIRKGK